MHLSQITTYFKSSLDDLQLRRQTVDLFFRDDDVDDDEAALRSLLDIFLSHEVPVNLEIIPGCLTDSSIALLRRYRDSRPDLFELNQHGWRHINHEVEGRKCEFGPSRSFEEQLADIANGKKVLEEAFGEAFSPVFTPPWNRCTTDTYRALDQLGFRALSKKKGKEELTGYSFRELSVTLDLYQWKNGATMRPAEQFISELDSQMGGLDRVGVMLHHKVMDESAFELLERLLHELRSHPFVRFHTFQSLLKSA
jgi:predicted deacetylase